MKTYRIMIRKPGGRYSQSSQVGYLLGMNRKAVEFDSKSSAERHIQDIVTSAKYLTVPTKYRPSYEVV